MYLIIVDGNVDTAEFCENRPEKAVIQKVVKDSIDAQMVDSAEVSVEVYEVVETWEAATEPTLVRTFTNDLTESK